MTKAELIDIVAEQTGLTKVDVNKTYDAIFETIVKALKKEGRFSVSGFGTFDVRKRKARTGINPQTKEPLKIKASKSVGFKQSTTLKEVIK
ncbi:MAG: HU family DNA-binding protein [Candidatus Sumerlaeia bacterium]|jgi:DNA-binding protein HU-beta|nr:HU family DNA-binding protein [Candidatus Sumerlaeia bacterium]